MTAAEARLRGTHQALTPVVDVAREPRWGRVEETYGEDPYLVSRLGIAAVRGFQGDATFRDKRHVIATLKHFVGHGQPESGMNCAPANVSMRVLRETFLYTFREALREAGAISVMASYNEIDGVPSHANNWLLRDVLRKEWGFKGFVVSDYFAIWELGYRPDTHGHFVAKDKKESCALAVKAGVNIELPDPDCYLHLVELVRKGVLKESELDELVAPMLFWKFEMGLFDDPYVDPDEADRVVGCDATSRTGSDRRARGHHAAQERKQPRCRSISSKIKTIAVIGPNANRSLLGGYSGVPKHDVTVLDGIKAKVGKNVKVLYSEGCKITVGGNWNQDEVVASDPEEDRKQIAEAVEVAQEGRRHRAGHRRQRADLARGLGAATTWATAPASISSAGRKNWSRPWSRWASRSSRSSSTAARFPSITLSAERAGHLRVLVSRPGNRPRRRRCALRRHQPRRQAAHQHSRAPPAICPRSTTTSPRRAAAICSTTSSPLYRLWLRPELYHLLHRRTRA